MTTTIHGLCLLLCHNLGILHQLCQWYLRIGANFSNLLLIIIVIIITIIIFYLLLL